MRVFMQHEETPEGGFNAVVEADFCNYRATLQGEQLGTFQTLEEAKAAITARMESRFGLIPADAAKPKLRKRTVFEPCEKHGPMFATESRERRAEVMVEGGYADSPCTGRECRMKPGTDFYTESFVAANPVCGIQGR